MGTRQIIHMEPDVLLQSVLDQILIFSRSVARDEAHTTPDYSLSTLSLPTYIFADGETTLLVK